PGRRTRHPRRRRRHRLFLPTHYRRRSCKGAAWSFLVAHTDSRPPRSAVEENTRAGETNAAADLGHRRKRLFTFSFSMVRRWYVVCSTLCIIVPRERRSSDDTVVQKNSFRSPSLCGKSLHCPASFSRPFRLAGQPL